MMSVDGLADFAQQLVTHHFVSHLDGRREAFRVRAAVAFDYNAIQP
jgi:hypothetical protein